MPRSSRARTAANRRRHSTEICWSFQVGWRARIPSNILRRTQSKSLAPARSFSSGGMARARSIFVVQTAPAVAEADRVPAIGRSPRSELAVSTTGILTPESTWSDVFPIRPPDGACHQDVRSCGPSKGRGTAIRSAAILPPPSSPVVDGRWVSPGNSPPFPARNFSFPGQFKGRGTGRAGCPSAFPFPAKLSRPLLIPVASEGFSCTARFSPSPV